MEEIWKDIEEYKGLYQVSNLGNVRSLDRLVKAGYNNKQNKKGRRLTKLSNQKGYLVVKLSKENHGKRILIHRLVAKAFIPNPENKPQVNHIDGNKENNNVSNLEWCTNSENQIHAYKTGLNKVTEEQRKKMSEKKKGKSLSEEVKKLKRKNAKTKKAVICITTGEIFESIMDASRKTNINSGSISNACNNNKRSAGKDIKTNEKLYWKFI